MNLMQEFSNISGLRLNMSKCDFVWIGKDKSKDENICGLVPRTKFKSLGVLFSTMEACVHENIEPRIRRMRDITNMWRGRDLSIKGRITLIKKLMASQFTYLATAMVIPAEIISKTERELGMFLWNGRTPKVRRDVICQPIEKGGLGAVNFGCYIKSIQLAWLRRMISGPEPKWRAVLQGAIGGIQLADLLRGDMDGPQIKKMAIPEFYCRVIAEYYRMKPVTRITSATEVKTQALWFNKHIQIDHNVIFFRSMYRQGIKYVGQLESNGKLVTYPEILQRYPGLRITQYKYQCLQQAIPIEWRAALRGIGGQRGSARSECDAPLTVVVNDSETELTRMTCNKFYRTQLPKDVVPVCRRKWAAEQFDFSPDKWKEVCCLPYQITESTKFQALQYRIMNRYVPTRKFLFDRKIVESPQCLYCSHTDNIYHFLYNCNDTVAFWRQLVQETNQKIGGRLRLNPEIVIFGHRRVGKLANYIMLIAKQYVMNKKLNGEPLSTFGFWVKVRKQYEVDKCNAKQTGGKWEKFQRKWRRMNFEM